MVFYGFSVLEKFFNFKIAFGLEVKTLETELLKSSYVPK